MNVILTPQDISNCSSIKAHPDVPSHINDVVFNVKHYIDSILRDVSQKYELLKKDGKSQEYSLIDIRNFRNMNVKDLEEMFIVNFGLDFRKLNDIYKINELFQESINIIQTRYGRKIDQTLISKTIKSSTDVKELLDTTGKGNKGVQICAISKVFLSLALLRKDPRITYIDKVHSDITGLIIAPFSNLDQEIEGIETGNILIDEKENKIISSKLLHRSKSISSCVGKQMGNINSNSVDDFKDLHGFTVEIDSQDITDMIFIFQKYYFLLLEKAKKKKDDGGSEIANIVIENQELIDCYFENGVLKVPDLEKLKDDLDADFYEVFYESLKISKEKNDIKREHKGTAKSYKDLNITLKYKTKTHPKLELPEMYSGMEIKFTQKGNENEKGLAFHGIFDYKKRFREMTRIFGFIHHEDILFFVNEFFTTLDAKLSSKGKKRSKFFSELLSDIQSKHPELIDENFSYIPNNTENLKEIQKILYKYLLKEVVEVKISKASKHTFFVHKSYFDLTPELNKEVIPV